MTITAPSTMPADHATAAVSDRELTADDAPSSAPRLDISRMLERAVITSVDVANMRRVLFGAPSGNLMAPAQILRGDAEALLELNDACEIADPRWSAFFVDALLEFVVRQEPPRGYVSPANAEWLTMHIRQDGHVQDPLALELLIRVLEDARYCPSPLIELALLSLKEKITAKGHGAALSPVLSHDDLSLVRRVLFACGGDGHVAVTRLEAEFLFDINDVIDHEESDPEWRDVFVKAIVNHLMFVSGHKVPSRTEALRKEAWLNARPGVLSFMSRMVGRGPAGVLDAYTAQSSEERALEALEAQKRAILLGEEITTEETDWLQARLGQNQQENPVETLLLSTLRDVAPKLAPTLATLASAETGA